MSERKCAACGGTDLEPGCLVESVPGGGAAVSTWLRGAPQFSAWRGLKLRGKEQFHVRAYACRECQHLNLYLGPQVSPQASGPRT